jgi:hypothetical protein
LPLTPSSLPIAARLRPEDLNWATCRWRGVSKVRPLNEISVGVRRARAIGGFVYRLCLGLA